MTEVIKAYPLQWPAGWKRTDSRQFGRFGKQVRHHGVHSSWRQKSRLSIADATQRVLHELLRMGISDDDVVISTNLKLRLDGLPRSGQAEPQDPGAAVYWRDGRKNRCMAIDLYDRVADNLAAIAATIEAMRAIERHGGAAILDRAFTGFQALPSPTQWWHVLGFEASSVTGEQIEARFRELAMQRHPDRGGSEAAMAELNWAREAGLAEAAQRNAA